MEEQSNMLLPNSVARQSQSVKLEGKKNYVPPSLKVVVVELEYNLAAGSVIVKETDDIVQESWKVDDGMVKEIDIDFL